VHEIHQYDIQKNGELIDTLECYLNHKQSIRKTSELMGVHARTVSYRLQKIVKLTRIDFDNIVVSCPKWNYYIKNIGIVIKDNESHG